MKVRGYEIEIAVLDTELREHGRTECVPHGEDGKHAEAVCEMTDLPEELVQVNRFVLYVDEFRFVGVLPSTEQFWKNMPGQLLRLVATCDLIDSVIDLIEQVANQ